MSDSPYQEAGGPLLADSPVYIPREADEKAATRLRRMDYISLIEPRQYGKTSLINQLISRFSPLGYQFLFRDMSANRSKSKFQAEWYMLLGQQLSRQLDFLPFDQRPKPPIDSVSWEGFLVEVAERAKIADQRVVIVLDEIGVIPEDLATDFFSIIRSVYTSRQSLTYWQYLTFVMAGAFNPKDLIKDPDISNFNVAKRIPLNDFTIPQMTQLVSHLGLPDDINELIVEQVYYWTNGQPYLSHQLCVSLSDKKDVLTASNVKSLVADAVNQFFHEDTDHLERIKKLRPDLLAYIRQITSESRARFSAGLNDKHFHLANIIGILKASTDGKCQIRNRIYERALAEVEVPLGFRPAYLTLAQVREQVFISYCHKDKKWLDELLTMLSPLKDKIKIWEDNQLETGTEWREEIGKAIAAAKLAVLLVSPNFLASDFIVKYELPLLLEAAKKEGFTLLWIAISTCWFTETGIAAFQAVNDPSKPLDSLKPMERKKEWVRICDKIKLVANAH